MIMMLPDYASLSRRTAGVGAAGEQATRDMLACRGEELSLEDIASLAKAILADPDSAVAQLLKERAGQLRQELFGNDVIAMAPVEMSNVCASDCVFCGWRVSNRSMPRLRLPVDLVMMQTEYLVRLGIRHIEFVSGDDVVAVREMLPPLIRETRKLYQREGVQGKISFCSMALTGEQYLELREAGADAMILWQETYSPDVYRRYIAGGFKATGIDSHWRPAKGTDGYGFRLESQDRALRCGLEVGLGSMLGLNPDIPTEIVAVVDHARGLARRHEVTPEHPIIIGMPVWNPITTPETDMRPGGACDFEQVFPLISALYLLALPHPCFWVFPNCRVSMRSQIEAVRTSGCFTSTEVKLGPGGYLPSVLRHAQHHGNAAALRRRIADGLNLASDDDSSELDSRLDALEQFVHNYATHEEYCREMNRAGLEVLDSAVSARHLIPAGNAYSGSLRKVAGLADTGAGIG